MAFSLYHVRGNIAQPICIIYAFRSITKKNKIHRYQQIIADLRFARIIKLSVPQKPAFVVGCKKESFGNQVSQGDDNNLKFRVSACLESKFGKYLEPKQEISRATLTDYQY